jgi:predicted nuclease of predicted toxin-antitoxin system
MNHVSKLKLKFYSYYYIFFNSFNAEDEEIYLKAISDQIQVITKDLKTLEKAVYQKSDIVHLNLNSISQTD